ncbi:DoxX family membrane protein [Hymenobacter rubripertinctus]|uniref:DoxX family membrane protein n=1 Tax=Hymenobacter rubripertinctus TaxID=2029981 RepID=A0A418QLX1_9BACT|nr:DoxX family membrane protein [Hymenobacter rubripertinctus]RIY06144.1 DoxX family membrane protein [Hymenobacter rubripertinctus]
MNLHLFYLATIVVPALATAVALRCGGWQRRLYVGGSRLLLGALMLGGGLYKLSGNHLPGLMGPPMNPAFLAQHQLEIFARFIGAAQLLIGLLLLTGRFALLGAVLLVPMWLNIIFLTWSQHWPGTPYLVTGFLVLTTGLLLHDFPRLKFIFYPPQHPDALCALPLRTAGPGSETLGWLALGTVVGGALLYPVSPTAMLGMMGLGGALLLLTTGWSWRRGRPGPAATPTSAGARPRR